jgi:hypothetical protein
MAERQPFSSALESGAELGLAADAAVTDAEVSSLCELARPRVAPDVPDRPFTSTQQRQQHTEGSCSGSRHCHDGHQVAEASEICSVGGVEREPVRDCGGGDHQVRDPAPGRAAGGEHRRHD